MTDPNEKRNLLAQLKDFKNIVLLLLAIATGVTTYLNLVRSNQMQVQLDQADLDLKNLESNLSQKRYSNEQFLLLNREVRESLDKKNNCDQQLLLVMLIDQMLADNIRVRNNIRDIVRKRSAPSCNLATDYITQTEKDERRYDSLEIIRTASDYNKTNTMGSISEGLSTDEASPLRIDVFHLAEDPAIDTKALANLIKEALDHSDIAYDVRVRLLPNSVNARSGYRIQHNQVRFEASEKTQTDKVLNLLAAQGILQQQPSPVQITYNTSNYISIFIKNR